MNNLLILLLFPLVTAVVLLFVKQNSLAKRLALILTLIQAGLSIPLITNFVPDASIQFEQSYPWISQLNIVFHIGLDGISLPLILLTNALIPLIVLGTFGSNFKGSFYALVSFMQTGLLLVFVALDAFTFYVGWELALIPIYFICALWGEGDRIAINLKFFVYTFLGSILMLVALVFLGNQTPGGDYEWATLTSLSLSESTQGWVFWAFFFAFAVKIPIFPFHTWQPNTYTFAPTAGTMLLAGIMLKMGTYALIRWLIPVVPEGVQNYGTFALTLAIIGLVYASIIAFKQRDAKRLIAYSSIAHVGLISAGIFSWNQAGIQGAIFQMVSHGISVVALFYVIEIWMQRTNTRDLSELGGLAKNMPRLAALLLILTMGAVGLPLTANFIGEFLLLKGVYEQGLIYAAFGGLTLIFSAVYMLRMYQKAMLGPVIERFKDVSDVRGHELILLVVLVGFTLYLGLFPNGLLNLSQASVEQLIQQVNFN
ncbi:MAG TPA: NADH-quinone oxidoreductase subunit M [Candidatus Sphingobacterium stercoripullorum]|uniref:NADH-quinone oxidoreductase subunit M n=1 Tax=Candidatus Sphingobacterium stercoripullorum TaxID=2838759 RepID=A0A9D1W975_9SPHI|nr:NADH-quinone oxidoreductase subunit M [Candidatus Sphingobacterium stercoripullorum]